MVAGVSQAVRIINTNVFRSSKRVQYLLVPKLMILSGTEIPCEFGKFGEFPTQSACGTLVATQFDEDWITLGIHFLYEDIQRDENGSRERGRAPPINSG